MQLHGIIPPIVTPMKDDESLDLPRLRELIDRLLLQGVHGIFVLGTTGEFYALDESEKQAVIAEAVAHVNGRVPLLAGTGGISTREVIRLTRMAEREGANAVSIITPYYISPSQSEMIQHYQRIAESTAIPVVLYNNPSTCGGLRLEAESVARLSELKNVVGIKDSSGDMQHLLEILSLVPRSFAVLQGRDTLIFPALQAGAKGAVPSMANLAARLCVEIYTAFQRGDWQAAEAAQRRFSPIRLGTALGTAPGAVKAGMALLRDAFPVGPSRGPIAPLSAEKQQQLRAVLAAAGL
jgi:4-hydroxy-tetrahydrodipicolinate synthase